MPTAELALRLRRSTVNLSSLIFLALFVSACASTPKKENTITGEAGSAQGQWRGKALVVSSKNGKKQSNTIDLQIVAKEPSSLRIDVTGPFGVHLASLATQESQAQILLPREKKFLATDGKEGKRLIRTPGIPVKVTPEEVLAILFERPLEKLPGWKCTRAGENIVFSCDDEKRGARVLRRPSEGDERRFELSDSSSSAELVVVEAKAKVELGESTFTLREPEGFRRETLN